MVRIRNISKKYYFRQIVACWLICSMLLTITPTRLVMADPPSGQLPEGWEVVTGSVGDFDYSTLNELHIRNIADGTIIIWHRGFNIGSEAWTEFQLINAGQNVLNRDVTGSMSQIYGKLTSNGGVWILNPAGIVFGPGAKINVAQLVASSLDITDEDFLNGSPYNFTGGADAGVVENYSTNFTAERIALIGREVINKGALVADKYVVMAAGDNVLISEDSSVMVEVAMGGQAPSLFKVENHGDGITVDETLDIMKDGTDGTARVVLAAGDIWSAALVKAYSDGGSDAVATVDIEAAGNVLVENEVIAEAVGNGDNEAEASIRIDAGGDVDVIAHAWMERDELGNVTGHEGKASIQTKTQEGITNTSEILICADGHVTVEAEGLWSKEDDLGAGSNASIQAIAQSGEWTAQNNFADVQIDAKEGINVTSISKPYNTPVSASITAEAYNGQENTANILTCSNKDVLVKSEWDGETPSPSTARIRSVAGTYRYLKPSSAKTTVISHQGTITVDSTLGGNASIESEVFGYGPSFTTGEMYNSYPLGTATTQVYGTDVLVTGDSSFIRAIGPMGTVAKGSPYSLTGRFEETSDGAKLVIDYSWCDDCPDCPPCKCKEPPPVPPEEEVLFAPVAPLPPYHIPRIEGCPELTQAAAAELGIPEETLQVGMGNSLALNPNIQPCQACELLVKNAAILKDVDGSRMAAMVQVFNAIAPADAPYTPEMATSIAMVFEGAAEGSQYASAMEFIDAFVQYAAALGDLGSPTGDSTAFVMDKYGAGLSDNGNMANFVAGRIEGGQTF
jgi:filamentous hemagglutinin family protein